MLTMDQLVNVLLVIANAHTAPWRALDSITNGLADNHGLTLECGNYY